LYVLYHVCLVNNCFHTLCLYYRKVYGRRTGLWSCPWHRGTETTPIPTRPCRFYIRPHPVSLPSLLIPADLPFHPIRPRKNLFPSPIRPRLYISWQNMESAVTNKSSSGDEIPERDVTCLISVYLFTTELRPIWTSALFSE